MWVLMSDRGRLERYTGFQYFNWLNLSLKYLNSLATNCFRHNVVSNEKSDIWSALWLKTEIAIRNDIVVCSGYCGTVI